MSPAQQIVSEVARAHDVRVSWMKGKGPRSRVARVVRARDEAMTRILRERGWASTEIGEFFGRHHSSVLEAIARHEQRLAERTAP